MHGCHTLLALASARGTALFFSRRSDLSGGLPFFSPASRCAFPDAKKNSLLRASQPHLEVEPVEGALVFLFFFILLFSRGGLLERQTQLDTGRFGSVTILRHPKCVHLRFASALTAKLSRSWAISILKQAAGAGRQTDQQEPPIAKHTLPNAKGFIYVSRCQLP